MAPMSRLDSEIAKAEKAVEEASVEMRLTIAVRDALYDAKGSNPAEPSPTGKKRGRKPKVKVEVPA